MWIKHNDRVDESFAIFNVDQETRRRRGGVKCG